MNKKKTICIILTLLWVAVIFTFSLQPAKVSSDISSLFLDKFLKTVFPSVYERLETIPKEQVELWHTIVRKCAHFLEFCILGILSSLTVSQTKLSRKKLITMCFCVAVAATDETIQLFVDGRAGRVMDVLIDSIGSMFGIFISFLICEFILTCSKMRDNITTMNKKRKK